MPEFWMLYHVVVLGGLLLALFALLANLSCFGGLKKAAPFPPDAPLVSVLVPARNEARNIGACVASLFTQDYPNYELLILDDHSQDETSKIISDLIAAAPAPNVRLLSGVSLPAGWTGKSWACHQLAAGARGQFLLFTDADTEHQPGTIAAAVAHAQRHRADLLSAWPRLITGTLGEKLIVPMIVVLGLTLYPHWLLVWMQGKPSLAARLPHSWRRSLGAANGQFLLFTRAAYDRIGGHGAIRDHLVEDVALGRAIAAEMHNGLRLVNCDAVRFSTCRMYRSLGEVWEGFTKNVRSAFEDSLAGFVVVGVGQICLFLLPFAFIFFPEPYRPLVVAQIVVIFVIRALLAARFRTSVLSVILHPAGQLLALAIGLNSWRRTGRSGVVWKGRTYQSGPTN